MRTYLGNIGVLWKTSEDGSRQGLVLALFDRITVLGFREVTYNWSATARAHGLDRVIPAEFYVDLSQLGLRGAPTGQVKVRSAPIARVLPVEPLAGHVTPDDVGPRRSASRPMA